MKKIFLSLLIVIPAFVFAQQKRKTIETDVLVIGGGTGGTAAAIQCARLGVKTILTEETSMLGGMLTAAGVSCTDGNDQFPSGMWEEFRQALYKHYGRKQLNSGWVSNTCFEPHVGDSIFKAWAGKEKNLRLFYEYRLQTVMKQGNMVTGVLLYNEKTKTSLRIKAKVVVDGTELGDVFAAAGAQYDLGMDDPAISGEKEARKKNNIIQDLTWAAVLKDYGPGADKTIPRPAGYDSTKYFCSTSDAPCNDKPYIYDVKKVLNYGKLPNGKYMLNWPAHGNDYYLNVVENNYEFRIKSYELAKQHTLGFIYFLQTQLGMKNIGLADDELNGGLALIPYNREGRRVRGVVRMTLSEIKNPYGNTLYRTGIAVGDYPVDHHHAQYPGKVPEIEFPHIPAYNIPLGCLIPEKIDGLIVCEKGISVTNLVNGTTRLQPVVLLTGQAAGVLAAKAVQKHAGKIIGVKSVSVRHVQEELLKAKCYLVPFSDVKPGHPYWEQVQKAGATGILKGTGKPEGWANKMFFYPDSIIAAKEVEENIAGFLPDYRQLFPDPFETDSLLTIAASFKLLERMYNTINKKYKNYPSPIGDVFKKGDFETIWNNIGYKNYQPARLIKRFEFAVLLDSLLYPFNINVRYINLSGK